MMRTRGELRGKTMRGKELLKEEVAPIPLLNEVQEAKNHVEVKYIYFFSSKLADLRRTASRILLLKLVAWRIGKFDFPVQSVHMAYCRCIEYLLQINVDR